MYEVRILKDSLAPCGERLTTWELTYPRFVHSELMTHRLFSRNAASSRAIPTPKLLERIREDPALPVWWGKNQRGMQAREEVSGVTKDTVEQIWLHARDKMLHAAESLHTLGLHKQIANRLLEPWMFITVIVSSTTYENWFKLRAHEDAQPEIAWVAMEMEKKYQANTPDTLKEGEWHLPMSLPEDPEDLDLRKKINVARCARVSYLTHDGRRDYQKDVALHDQLAADGHWSPFEHVAMALSEPRRSGNFLGFHQYRKDFPLESGVPA